MKVLLYLDEELEADIIVKGEDYIVGYDAEKINILFSFEGVLDFTDFSLKDGAEWDLPDPKPKILNVVDDLTTGGREDVLSAEQGKVIKDYYDQQAIELAKVASDAILGRVKIDGKTIKTNTDGQIYSPDDLDVIDMVHVNDIFAPTTVDSGVYGVLISGRNDMEDGQYIVTMNANVDKVDGSIVRLWTMHKIIPDESNYEAITGAFYSMADMVYEGQIIFTGKAKRIDSTINTTQIESDIQTLFTGWANETNRAATALTQKGVNTPQGSTMKTVVDNISLIPTGATVRELNSSSTATKAFNYMVAGTVTSYYVSVDITNLGFKPIAILIENANFEGKSTYVKVDYDTVLSARVAEGENSGTSKWIRLGQNGFPTSGTLDIPVVDADDWKITVIG